ncbi:hypothetical protein RF11_04913 [Thelohanellus kitauei]|uniref:Uncharacterized protein n=1 Tax=Thelohanellus kitauei TaxID=669202 RepID=A0A0C2NEM0_THEKT|nr:hypothetical protein RF11_04913 [Thelohanellus kitauei]
MGDFIFSEAFVDFIMECFIKWYRSSDLWKQDSPDLFLFVLLCLCLILRGPKHRAICDQYRERMFSFFGPHPKLENRSLLNIISKERPNNSKSSSETFDCPIHQPISYWTKKQQIFDMYHIYQLFRCSLISFVHLDR